MNELALFAGAGGGILGGLLLGWRTVCAVERDAYAASVLLARQNDGTLTPFPVWDDVCTFDGRPWRGIVDVVSGGFPCQDISVAGKGAGLSGARSGLWSEFARIIGEVQPRFVFVENSPALVTRGLGVVLGDLFSLGYDARWCVVSAANAGAPHRRERIWIVANANRAELWEQPWRIGGTSRKGAPQPAIHGEPFDVADSNRITRNERRSCDTEEISRGRNANRGRKCSHTMANSDSTRKLQSQRIVTEQRGRSGNGSWWRTEPDVGRVANGVAARVDKLRAIGNGQVPAVARLAWEILK